MQRSRKTSKRAMHISEKITERKQQKAKMQTTGKVNTKAILEIGQTNRRVELAWEIVWKT